MTVDAYGLSVERLFCLWCLFGDSYYVYFRSLGLTDRNSSNVSIEKPSWSGIPVLKISRINFILEITSKLDTIGNC